MLSLTEIGVIVGILSLLISLFALKKKTVIVEKKLIRYGFSIRKMILSNPLYSNKEFDLKLNGKNVRDLFQLQLIIANRGTTTLTPKDFVKPLRLEFENEVNLFPFNIRRVKSDLPIKYESFDKDGKSVIEINTDIFEPNDKIYLDLIYESNGHSTYKLNGRIINGKIKYVRRPHEEDDEDYKKIIRNKYESLSMIIPIVVWGLILLLFYGIYQGIFYLFPDFINKIVQYIVSNISNSVLNIIKVLFFLSSLLFVLFKIGKYIEEHINEEIKIYEKKINDRSK